MVTTIPVAAETFSAFAAKTQTGDSDFMDAGYTRCGSGMGESRDD